MIFTRDQLKFDTGRFDFASLVRSEINAHLAGKGSPPIHSLERVHEIDGIREQLEEYRQMLFRLFRKPHFQTVYRALGKSLIETHFSDRALIQKTPTVRLHLAGGVSVSFHSDAWYGHGRRAYSFWLPLTTVFGSNSLQMARSLEDSQAFLRDVAKKQLDLDDINEHAAKICEPVAATYGDLVVFNSEMVHGTITNGTFHSRVSFDFRIAETSEDIGNKPIANFYNYAHLVSTNASAEAAPATPSPAYSALMYSGTCRGISAKSQLVFLTEYARMNGINIVGSESEIVVFDYAPVLQKYARNPPSNVNCLLLFSVDLLPRQPELRRKIYQNAIDRGLAVIFGAEDVTIKSSADIDRVERFFQAARLAA